MKLKSPGQRFRVRAGKLRARPWSEAPRATRCFATELWDTASRNLLDDLDTEALEAVRELIVLNGPELHRRVALTRVDGAGRMATLSVGESLAVRARVAESPRGRLST